MSLQMNISEIFKIVSDFPLGFAQERFKKAISHLKRLRGQRNPSKVLLNSHEFSNLTPGSVSKQQNCANCKKK